MERVHFTPQYLNKSIEFKGNKGYQRNDLINPMQITGTGKTNLELMKASKAPFGPDGKRVNIHHMLQHQEGALAEMTETFHQQYSAVIHINPSSIPSGIDRKAFNKWRGEYWKNRAKDFEKQ